MVGNHRQPPNDRTPHLRQPCHRRARHDTVQKGLASAIAGRVRAGTLFGRVMVPYVASEHANTQLAMKDAERGWKLCRNHQ